MGDPDWYKNRPSAQPAAKLSYPMVKQVALPPKAPKLMNSEDDVAGWVFVGFNQMVIYRKLDEEGKTPWGGVLVTKGGNIVVPDSETAEEAEEKVRAVWATKP